MLVFVPIDAARLQTLLNDGLTDVAAHAATPALYQGLGLDPSMDEDAEFGALTYASVACLLTSPLRGVAVCEVPDRALSGDDDFGRVSVAQVAPADLRSLFIDEPEALPLTRAAHRAVAGTTLDQAWEDAAVERVLTEADLLWHDADEGAMVLAALSTEGN